MQPFQPDSLPYNTAPHYWLAVQGGAVATLDLAAHGFQPCNSTLYLAQVPCPWFEAWKTLETLIESKNAQDGLQIAIIPAAEEPSLSDIESNLRPLHDIKDIAGSLWLGDALLTDRVLCYLQPVQDRRGKIFGYESFARVRMDDGEIIGGGAVFAASKALKLEYRLDRYLHQKAVEAFVASGVESRLFINFQSGFIQRPEVYLEGLNHVVKKYNVPEKNIVLDFTQSESQLNLQHLKAICQYCRQQGYSIALDDITTLKSLEGLLYIIQPDFIKLDLEITREAESQKTLSVITQIVETAHNSSGITVIAEGIENEAVYTALMQADVDLFQGYFIGAPAPVTSSPIAQTA